MRYSVGVAEAGAADDAWGCRHRGFRRGLRGPCRRQPGHANARAVAQGEIDGGGEGYLRRAAAGEQTGERERERCERAAVRREEDVRVVAEAQSSDEGEANFDRLKLMVTLSDGERMRC